jgi:CxxC-x17-CxxC domain-containing protein
MITVTCAECGVQQQVPADEADDNFIICHDCYEKDQP